MSTAAAAVFLVLPAPVVSSRVSFLARAGAGGSIGVPGGLAGDSGIAAQLSRAGSPASRIRVGGYLGFADSLNTALRGGLGNTLVLQVRAQRPSYWVGETFDTWQGQSWTEAKRAQRPLRGGSPFVIPVSVGEVALGQSDLQTFYVASATADLVFHAESADRGLVPDLEGLLLQRRHRGLADRAGDRGDLHRRVTGERRDTRPAPSRRRPRRRSCRRRRQEYEQLPHAVPAGPGAGAVDHRRRRSSTYDKVQALIGWIGSHTRYSLDIPPLPAGADTVDEFLFGNRVGFCEQISTSLAVMLRSLGIPAREAVGYVPGGYNPITDLWQVHADDAHAWVQVWFPGYGWQNFDPTAAVPAGEPEPGRHGAEGRRRRAAPHPVGAGRGGGGRGGPGRRARCAAAGRARRRGRRGWRAASSGPAGGRAGRAAPARPWPSTPRASTSWRGSGSTTWGRLASSVEASAYGGREPPPAAQRAMEDEARRTRVRPGPARACGAEPAVTDPSLRTTPACP